LSLIQNPIYPLGEPYHECGVAAATDQIFIPRPYYQLT
jgi:hypothetical protein